MGINFAYTLNDDPAELEVLSERIIDEFEARRTAQAEFFQALKVAPGVAEILSGDLVEWHCRTPELTSLRFWALERQMQVARYCPVRRRRVGLIISQRTPTVKVLHRLLGPLCLQPQLLGSRMFGMRQLRLYGLSPFQKRSRWLAGVDIPGIEWY